MNSQPTALIFTWLTFVLCMVSYLVHRIADGNVEFLATVSAIPASVTCGISWLLTRTIFRSPEKVDHWALAVLSLLLGTGVFLVFSADHNSLDPLARIVSNTHILVSSTVLLLPVIEALDGYKQGLADKERRFRQTFLAVYILLLFVAVICVRQSPDALWADTARSICAIFALIGGTLATWFRIHHPLHAGRRARKAKSAQELSDEAHLKTKIEKLLLEGRIYTDPELKVSDIARKTGEVEYKVTQCITGSMGFANFNRMINSFRIADAKKMLADRACDDLSILAIALDCGFGSIGVFNRAFKAQVDMTPSAYRSTSKLAVS